MPSVSQFVGALRLQGVDLRFQDGRLFVEGAEARLTPALVAQVRERRDELETFLRPRTCAECGEPCGSAERCSPCAASRVQTRRSRREEPAHA